MNIDEILAHPEQAPKRPVPATPVPKWTQGLPNLRELTQALDQIHVVLHVYRSGSSVICDPPVTTTDVDLLILVSDLEETGIAFIKWENCLEEFVSGSDKIDKSGYIAEILDGARFSAFRMGKLNVIITDDQALHIRSVAATLLAKELNLQDKQERIALFRAVKFGENYEGPLP